MSHFRPHVVLVSLLSVTKTDDNAARLSPKLQTALARVLDELERKQ